MINTKKLKTSFSSFRFGAGAIALTLTLSSCATISGDKALHFSVTGLISAFATCISNEESAILVGAGAGIGAGLTKEAYDAQPGGTGFDGEDMIANVVGAGVGTMVGYALCHQAPPPPKPVISDDPETNDLIIDALKLTSS